MIHKKIYTKQMLEELLKKACFFRDERNYIESEKYFSELLVISLEKYEDSDIRLANIFNNYALLKRDQRSYTTSEEFFRKALEI